MLFIVHLWFDMSLEQVCACCDFQPCNLAGLCKARDCCTLWSGSLKFVPLENCVRNLMYTKVLPSIMMHAAVFCRFKWPRLRIFF